MSTAMEIIKNINQTVSDIRVFLIEYQELSKKASDATLAEWYQPVLTTMIEHLGKKINTPVPEAKKQKKKEQKGSVASSPSSQQQQHCVSYTEKEKLVMAFCLQALGVKPTLDESHLRDVARTLWDIFFVHFHNKVPGFPVERTWEKIFDYLKKKVTFGPFKDLPTDQKPTAWQLFLNQTEIKEPVVIKGKPFEIKQVLANNKEFLVHTGQGIIHSDGLYYSVKDLLAMRTSDPKRFSIIKSSLCKKKDPVYCQLTGEDFPKEEEEEEEEDTETVELDGVIYTAEDLIRMKRQGEEGKGKLYSIILQKLIDEQNPLFSLVTGQDLPAEQEKEEKILLEEMQKELEPNLALPPTEPEPEPEQENKKKRRRKH